MDYDHHVPEALSIEDNMGREAILILAGVLAIILLAAIECSPGAAESDASYWNKVDEAVGIKGTMLAGGVYKTELPPGVPDVKVGDVLLRPAMAADSWVSFVRMGDEAMMMGDIVVPAGDLGPVQRRFVEEGIDITAIHNTLVGESPQVYDMHISGRGNAAVMAASVRAALEQVNVTHEEVMPAPGSSGQLKRLDEAMGYRGRAENGVYVYEVPRAERITMDGMEIPSTMDVSTTIKFQPLGGGKAAITGDFILRPDEVKTVMKTLSENGIVVTALHTHMLTEEPRLFMMHFWATGDEAALAKALRQALDNTNSLRPYNAG
ncbi:conserved hypothetical protein [Methanocella paludicola SANAE]|uniref:DUF1259 domain-containing protein n=1 Tax=Methanocella paludicola (strain DSM 17711 / JCM 13418 / NBRC 101707 / SANAE) TaxID=304371 RepID=D1YY60_METPS|nr:DUF1259 domain-containing protein [Methanocella paludicola]BAI61382.1 conserved hypothetical protein [Methanocella paludicola SANAE]